MTLDLTAGGQAVDAVVVENARPGAEVAAYLTATDAEANASVIANVSADRVLVNVTLRNTGPVAGNRTVTVTAANGPVAERTVHVGANATRTVKLIADLSALDRERPTLVEANEVEADTIPPADARSTPDPDSTGTTVDSPFALAGAALLARRE